jgi:hypothetical protein
MIYMLCDINETATPLDVTYIDTIYAAFISATCYAMQDSIRIV